MTRSTAAFRAAFVREAAALRLNRFLHGHLALAAVAGLLPLFTPNDAVRAAPIWSLQTVLYGLSLSSVLLGLSSAHGEADEHEMLFSQPMPRRAWLGGKVAALAALVFPAAILLVAPAALAGGVTSSLVAVAAAAAGVCLALATLGLAIGCWVRDQVRGLLTALGVWFLLLFGTDLALLAVAGAPWVQARQDLWVGALMANPLDALRVTVLYVIEDTAYAAVDAGGLVTWWLAHAGAWLGLLIGVWTAAAFAAAVRGIGRKLEV